MSRSLSRPAAVTLAAVFSLLFLGVMLLGGGSAKALVPWPEDYNEPNDSFPAATALQNGVIARGSIPAQADKDYFYLDLSSSGSVTVDFTTGGYLKECQLAFQAEGSDTIIDLAWDKDYDDDGSFHSTGTAGPGRFFAIVSLGNGQTTGAPYTLTVSFASGGGNTFPDVPVGSEFYDAITYLADEDVVSGYSNGNFGPHDLVTRQQFAKMIVRAVGYLVSTSDICQFIDVQTSYPGYYIDPSDPLYPDHYIAVAAQHHITVGETAYTFGPYNKIRLAQVVTMVVRTGEDLGLYDSPPHSYVPPFDDFGEPHYAYAREGAAHGLFGGYSGPWGWYSSATRGQCAFFIWKLMLAFDGGDPNLLGGAYSK